jgi:O-antigen ligase
MEIASASDASTQWRDLENSNLIFTLRQHPLFGWGWGHEYIEARPLPDVSRFYKEYRLIAHNSVLWLLGLSGIVGFTMLWTPVVAGVYLATRSYHFSRSSAERTAAATALGLIACYVNQAWGDIGAGAPIPTLLLACALAASGKLARITGAWPARVKLIDVRAAVGASPTDLA